MLNKKVARLRRARKARVKILELKNHRLCVHRTPKHIYAQVIAPDGAAVVASASTLDPAIRQQVGYGGNVAAAEAVGASIAERAKRLGIERLAFDRSGFKYHGRVKAVAEAARKGGLTF